MSATVSTRWYFSDWQSDPGLGASSLAARGLWMEILAVAAQNSGRDHGAFVINGRVPTSLETARLARCAETEIVPLLAELERNEVFVRDERGAICCRHAISSYIAKSLRIAVLERDEFRCVYCGEQNDLQLDHIFPRSRGGLNLYSNLVTACRCCNQSKGARTPEEWRQ